MTQLFFPILSCLGFIVLAGWTTYQAGKNYDVHPAIPFFAFVAAIGVFLSMLWILSTIGDRI